MLSNHLGLIITVVCLQYTIWCLYVFYEEYPIIRDQYARAMRMTQTETCIDPWERNNIQGWHRCDQADAFLDMPMTVRVLQAMSRRVTFISFLDTLQTYASANQIVALSVFAVVVALAFFMAPLCYMMSQQLQARTPNYTLPLTDEAPRAKRITDRMDAYTLRRRL